MKYLRMFNESVEEDDYKEFCNNNLAYLSDIGFDISVYEYGDLVIETKISNDFSEFTWNDIKDELIPFFELLDIKYNITDDAGDLPSIVKMIGQSVENGEIKYNYRNRYSINDILNDNVESDYSPHLIIFYVKGKKELKMMKYLRKFNESVKENLTDFCNDNLVYLIDEGFSIGVYEYATFKIIITKKDFKWSDIKDDFIPFLGLMSEHYKIDDIFMHTNTDTDKSNALGNIHILKEKIFNDKIDNSLIYDSITIYIKNDNK